MGASSAECDFDDLLLHGQKREKVLLGGKSSKRSYEIFFRACEFHELVFTFLFFSTWE